MKLRPALALLMLAPLLSGCVAAVIPIAAAGMIGRKMVVKRKPVRPAAPPLPVPAAGSPTEMTIPPGVFADFAAFAVREAELPQPDRISMVLAQPVSLSDPKFYACRPTRQTVLIDTNTLGRSDTVLAATLQRLRAAKIGVLWLGDAPGGYAALHARLTAAGLLGDGDRVYAVEKPGDRKQTLRIDLAHDYCILAMLVADRGSADEMYDYLRNPDDAFALDRYWGAGWFLVPPASGAAASGAKE